jgi:translation initiation factor IF-1
VPSEDAITVRAAIEQVLGNGLFRACLSNGHRVMAHSGRRDREKTTALRVGDGVRLEMSPFDMSKGRIVF